MRFRIIEGIHLHIQTAGIQPVRDVQPQRGIVLRDKAVNAAAMVFDLPLLVFSAVKGILKHIRIYSAAIAYVDIFSAVYAADKVYAVAGDPRNRASSVILVVIRGRFAA